MTFNDDNDDNDDDGLVPENHRIEDFETWLSHNAQIRHHNGNDDDDDETTRPVTADRQEALDRLRFHKAYQEELHARIFITTKTT